MTEAGTLLDLINAGGVIAILLVLFLMFYRGDLLSRRVYEELSKQLLGEMTAQVIASVNELLRAGGGSAGGD